MEKKLTRRQIEVLEAVYHKGQAHLLKQGSREQPVFTNPGAISNTGGARNRMIDKLERAGYITDDWPRKLTVKGLEAVRDDRIAMMAISEAEIESRIVKRKQLDAETEEQRKAERERREEERNARDAQSRGERIQKLRKLLHGYDATVFSQMEDEPLLAFASKVAAIESLY